ncbi:MAG: serine acetyltransferase [Bacteroidaceae bacterium]|nr:serine acetyltransferase [Bacteroidales bacterium]MBQ2787158.1 serine acetyltransferase [Bacteroidaceae bacterium]MBQ3121710.1 serine acetyltransferase [Bacteroidaceae bacterium]
MEKKDITKILPATVKALTECSLCEVLSESHHDGEPMPSGRVLSDVVELVRSIVFPGFFGDAYKDDSTLEYRTGLNVARVYDLLCEQIHAGLCFANVEGKKERRKMAKTMAVEFVESLPELRRSLLMDVVAMYDGDPAAKSYGEIISCYPAIKAIGNYRMAHKLIEIGVPLIPRIISELAHSETGIDIHPGATIGNYFAIDHGTGVVIGETCIIGNHVKLYQGVTLGAKSFPVDENGNPIKGIPRHPILEDNVIVYGNSTILGRVTIGKDAVIGANIWLMEDVAPGTKVVQKKNI